jgi:PAS domain S-box-containing protein
MPDRSNDALFEAKMRRGIVIGLAVGTLVSLFTGLLNWRNIRIEAEDADWVSHTYAVMNALRATAGGAVDLHTRARGFALSGDESLLQLFEPARKQATANVELVRHLTEDNPAQQVRVIQLAREIAAAIDAANGRIAVRRQTGKAFGYADLAAGEIPIESVRATFWVMQREEEKLLEERSRETARVRDSVRRGAILAVLPSLAFYLLAWIAASRALDTSLRSKLTVRGLMDSLQRRVAESAASYAALEEESARRSSAEGKLRASEEQVRLLLDGVADYAICMLDAAGRVVSWNTGASRIMGYGSEEMLGSSIDCFYTPEQLAAGMPERELQIAVSQGHFEGEVQRVRKTGELFWAIVNMAAMFDAAGGLRGFSKVLRDITGQKQAQAALKKQSALLDLAHDAIFARDMDNRVVFWNGGAERLYGWSAEEAIGKVTHDLLPTKFPAALADIDVQIRDKGEWEGELVHVTRQGIELSLACRWSLQRDDDGVPVAILEINRDITDRKKAERELHTLASIVQNSRDFIGLCGPDMHPLFVNKSGMDMVGLDTDEEMRQTRMLDYFWPGDREHIEQLAVPTLIREGSWSGEVRFRHFKTGKPIHTLWDAFVIRDEQGQTVAWATISPNLERMKLLQEALRESQERQAGIIDSAMDGIITIDSQQRIVVFNAAAERLFLCPAADALGQSIVHFIPERFRPAHSSHIRKFGETGVTNRAMGALNAIWARRTNGEEFEIEASISQVEAGGQRLFTVIMRDVTERKASEREVRRLNEDLEGRVKTRTAELQATNEELESFTYAVAHDLRAPLRQMAGFCGILLEEHSAKLEPEAKRYLGRVQNGASRMGRLVDELLRLGKVGRQSIRRELVDLNTVITEVVGLLEPEFTGRDVEWRISGLTPVACDPTLIRLIFQNLISNALKYSRTRARTSIEIGETEDSGYPIFFVRDNGVGFDMKYADKLFGVFQRLHREQDFEGTGVGLATVQRIVMKHGGAVWAEAAVDGGAAFFFTLGDAAYAKPEKDMVMIGDSR